MLRKSLMIGLGLLWVMSSLAAVELEIGRSVWVRFQTQVGKQYQVFTSTDVDSGEWVASGDPIKGTGEVYTFHQDSIDPVKIFFKVERVEEGPDPVFDEFTIADLNLVMVPIPAGAFVRGSPESDDDSRSNERPQTNVVISQPYWMSKYEVTIDQMRVFLLDGRWKGGIDFASPDCPISDNDTFSMRGNRFGNNGKQPMIEIFWYGAVDFCDWLTARESNAGRLPIGHEYRLPTEAQWEYACRAGTRTRFSYGDDPEYSELGKYAWFDGDWNGSTHPVGEKLPNHWGLYDMHGNVFEWCSDRYEDYWNFQGVELLEWVDWIGPTSGNSRVSRGGGWNWTPRACRSAYRKGPRNWTTDLWQGFRPVLVSIDYPKSP